MKMNVKGRGVPLLGETYGEGFYERKAVLVFGAETTAFGARHSRSTLFWKRTFELLSVQCRRWRRCRVAKRDRHSSNERVVAAILCEQSADAAVWRNATGGDQHRQRKRVWGAHHSRTVQFGPRAGQRQRGVARRCERRGNCRFAERCASQWRATLACASAVRTGALACSATNQHHAGVYCVRGGNERQQYAAAVAKVGGRSATRSRRQSTCPRAAAAGQLDSGGAGVALRGSPFARAVDRQHDLPLVEARTSIAVDALGDRVVELRGGLDNSRNQLCPRLLLRRNASALFVQFVRLGPTDVCDSTAIFDDRFELPTSSAVGITTTAMLETTSAGKSTTVELSTSSLSLSLSNTNVEPNLSMPSPSIDEINVTVLIFAILGGILFLFSLAGTIVVFKRRREEANNNSKLRSELRSVSASNVSVQLSDDLGQMDENKNVELDPSSQYRYIFFIIIFFFGFIMHWYKYLIVFFVLFVCSFSLIVDHQHFYHLNLKNIMKLIHLCKVSIVKMMIVQQIV